MYCIISVVLLVLWAVSGLERMDILIASIIFAVLYIPETYVSHKFKSVERITKESINSIFGIGSKRDDK